MTKSPFNFYPCTLFYKKQCAVHTEISIHERVDWEMISSKNIHILFTWFIQLASKVPTFPYTDLDNKQHFVSTLSSASEMEISLLFVGFPPLLYTLKSPVKFITPKLSFEIRAKPAESHRNSPVYCATHMKTNLKSLLSLGGFDSQLISFRIEKLQKKKPLANLIPVAS